MTALTARLVSYDLRKRLGGVTEAEVRVHSVFDSALNVILDDGNLAALLAPCREPTPGSAVLRHPINFRETGLSPGDRVVVGLSGAAGVCLSVPGMTPVVRPGCAGYAARLRLIADAALSHEHADQSLAPLLCHLFGLLPVLPHNAYTIFLAPRVSNLCSALGAADKEYGELTRLGADTAGCGAGLTPSSDDLMVGVFAALYGMSMAGWLNPTKTAARCNAVAAGATPRTTTISAHFLTSAANGVFSQDILSLLSAFFTSPNDSDTTKAALRLCALGSTSGTDTLCGIYLGFSPYALI